VTLDAVRITLDEANAFVLEVHRHHGVTTGHRFSLGAVVGGALVGVVIVGRPVAKGFDHERVLEVNRLASRGGKNVCSFLYARAAQIATLLGFRAVITYTLTSESGASLRACGWWPSTLDERNTEWNCEARPREVTKGQSLGQKVRWCWLTGCAEIDRAQAKSESTQGVLL
jgi:hypothetical protein